MKIRHCINSVMTHMNRMSRSVVHVAGNSKGAPKRRKWNDHLFKYWIYLQVLLLILLMFVSDVCFCGKVLHC